MSESYDAANLEAMSAAQAYPAAMLQLVLDKLALKGNLHRVADFGAGRGDYAAGVGLATGIPVLSYEPDASLHPFYPPGQSVTSDISTIPDESLDAAYSLNVLEHIPDDVAALRAWASKCKDGAYIFLLVPANPALWTPMDTLVGHQRRYMPDTLQDAVRSAGLEVAAAGWFDRTGYFVTRAYQVLNRLKAKEPGAGVVSKTQIKLFDRVFQLSEPVLASLALPFGKNCWVLARRPENYQ